jgi:hypothetical protein
MSRSFLGTIKVWIVGGLLMNSGLSFAYWLPFHCWTNLLTKEGDIVSPTLEEPQIFEAPFAVGEMHRLDISRLQIEGITVSIERVNAYQHATIHAITVRDARENILGQVTHVYTQEKMHIRVPIEKDGKKLFLNSYCSKFSRPLVEQMNARL